METLCVRCVCVSEASRLDRYQWFYLNISVFDRLQGLKGGGSTQSLQPLRDVENVQASGPEKDGPIRGADI